MARLPQPGGDDNQWGEILNDYLRVSHTDDGRLTAPLDIGPGLIEIDDNGRMIMTPTSDAGFAILAVSPNDAGATILVQDSHGESVGGMGPTGLFVTTTQPDGAGLSIDATSLNSSSEIIFTQSGGQQLFSVDTYGSTLIPVSNPDSTNLIVRAIAGQTADLQVWVDSDGATVANVSPNGSAGFGGTLFISPITDMVGLRMTANDSQTQDLVQIVDANNHNVLEIDAIGQMDVRPNGSQMLRITAGGIGFFGAVPALQQPAPTTLSDVINVLQAYGLVQWSLAEA